jgi:NTE family protein
MNQIENLVFQGGGIRGIAFGGALKWIEENTEILKQIKRIAGSSAGSICAGALAVGYTPNEIIKLMKDTNFQQFKDGSTGILGKLWGLINIDTKYGYYKGDKFHQWYRQILSKKTNNGKITFAELFQEYGIELVLTGSNLNKSLPIYFSHKNYPDMEVAFAVRISMSFPGVFEAVKFEGDLYVDGGLFNNYPIWIFDKEPDENLTDEHVINSKTLGFKLMSNGETENSTLYNVNWKINNVYDYMKCLIEGMSNEIERAAIHPGYWNRSIPINTSNISSMDFDLSEKQKMMLIQHGYEAAKKFFQN